MVVLWCDKSLHTCLRPDGGMLSLRAFSLQTAAICDGELVNHTRASVYNQHLTLRLPTYY
jgi:hypothetical protein